MIVFPPCKINLGLRILGKRADGYHDLETLFYPIPLNDALEIKSGSDKGFGIEFMSYGISIPGDSQNNLIVKAYELLSIEFDLGPVTIVLLKNIPMGAGLGGGSSDGAFALMLLNSFFGLNLDRPRLLNLALQLGSDCPFFIYNKPCIGEGRGERLTPIDLTLKGYWICMVKPNVHVSTAAAFGGLNLEQLTLQTGSVQTEINRPIETWKGGLKNDFESSVFNQHPILRDIKSQLYEAGAIYASMSGSGATIFGIFKQKPNLKLQFAAHFYFECLLP